MGGQGHLNSVVYIEPFGVVVHFLSHEGSPRHESPRLAEVSELEGLLDRVASFHLQMQRKQCAQVAD